MSDNLNSSLSPTAKTPRMGWLDALRGFTMILVVSNHVALKSFGMQIRWSAALQFFLFGNIVHRYWQQAQRLMDSKWFFPVVTLLAVVCTIEVLKWHTLRLAWASLPHTLAMFLLLSMVFMFFRYYHAFFEQTRFGSVLQFIGRRTLDIYLLHYFFLPKLPMVGEFFKVNRSNFILETTASFALAFLVIGFCIVTSQLLRVSPFLKKYLFGR